MAAASPGTTIGRNLRFLASLVAPLLLLALLFACTGLVVSRIGGITGALLGVTAGASLVLSALLVYWNLVEWLDLRLIRVAPGATTPLADGAVVAFEGVARVASGAPLVAPLSGARCAAYTYVVSRSRQSRAGGGTRRAVVAQGFHLVPTRIEGSGRSLGLGSFPSFETDLRTDADGARWGREAKALVDRLAGTATPASDRVRESRLLAVRHGEVDEVHEDFRMAEVGDSIAGLSLSEEVLPAGERVCVVGTFDQAGNRLVARRRRLGANLTVYRGSAGEIATRVGGELGWYSRAAAGLALVAAGILGVAWAL